MPHPSAWTKYFCPGQNSFCLGKKFCPNLKKYRYACEMDRKRLFSHGQIFSTAKKSFSIIFPSKYQLFSLGQKISSVEKKYFLDKKYFVQADRKGSSGKFMC